MDNHTGILRKGFPRAAVGIILAAWAVCVAIGLCAMLAYELTPAKTLAAADRWPAGTRLRHDANRPTLLMFVHPRCPCSRASLAELNLLVSQCGGRAAVRIVFVRPQTCEAGWERTDLFAAAQKIPGADVSCDHAGAEAKRFGASASGETLLYAADGRLLFQGGLTPSRGHQGDNTGRSAVASLIQSGRAAHWRSAVFGCGLTNHQPCKQAEAHAAAEATHE
jgi:hypothetical protein